MSLPIHRALVFAISARVKLEHKDGSPKLEVVYDICYQRKCGRH